MGNSTFHKTTMPRVAIKFAIYGKLKLIDHHFPAIYIGSVLKHHNFFCNTGMGSFALINLEMKNTHV